MTHLPLTRPVALLLALLAGAAPVYAGPIQQNAPPQTGSGTAQSGSTQQPPPATPPEQPVVQLPQSQLDQIKAAVLKETNLQLRSDPLTFRMTIEARIPSVAEMLGNYDLKFGPVPNAPMRHAEYLNMVTPQELYGSGGIRAYELLQGAIVNWLGKALIRKAIDELRDARTEREVQEIRARIERELAALRGGR
jgi:hypothetical protein